MQISHHQSNRSGIKKEWVMMAKRRSARDEVRSHEKEQVIVPRISNPTGQKKQRLIVAVCVVKI